MKKKPTPKYLAPLPRKIVREVFDIWLFSPKKTFKALDDADIGNYFNFEFLSKFDATYENI